MELFEYSHIFWDWNGTLLDDVEWCVNVVNTMLAERGLKVFECVDEYRGTFCFPVKSYYIRAGFDLERESFDALAESFTRLYYGSYESYGLNRDAMRVLAAFRQLGLNQIILSASEKNALVSQTRFFGVEGYFDEILGITNFFAESKIEIGVRYTESNRIKKALLIGDTEHDFETAKSIKADCILIAGGHQSKKTLLTLGVPVLDNLAELFPYLSLSDFIMFDI